MEASSAGTDLWASCAGSHVSAATGSEVDFRGYEMTAVDETPCGCVPVDRIRPGRPRCPPPTSRTHPPTTSPGHRVSRHGRPGAHRSPDFFHHARHRVAGLWLAGVELETRFELVTYRLRGDCSTN